MNAKLVFTLVAMAALCTSAFSLESSGDWYSQAQTLYKNGSYQEAISAFDEGLKMDPQNASAWHHRGMALAGMGQGVEANQSIQKAMELIDQRLQENPEDQEALWLRAEEMDLFGKSEEALEAYGRVAELNSSHALEAWIRESDILAALGRYNQSVESFSRAMALVPANKSESQLGFQRRSENTFIFTKAWLIRGQIHRVSIGLYNISSKSFDEIEQINSDFVAALQLRGKAVDSSRHYGYIMSSLNCDIYSFNVPKMLPQAWPPCLTIAQINPTEDDFIEIANNLKEAVSLHNWSLEIQGSKVSLPEYSLLPGKAVRVHLRSGQENETDLFLDSNLELNDTAGSISLRDGSGAKVASLDYWTKLDGSIAHQVTHYSGTAESDLEYPQPGEDIVVAERWEIGLKLAHSNHIDRDVLQEDTAEGWLKKGQELQINGSYEEAIQAYDKAIQIDPENSSAWISKGHISSFMDKTDETRKEYEIALGILNQTLEENPQDASAWIDKGIALSCLGRDAEASDAREKGLEIYNQIIQKNPIDANAWENKALALAGMGRWEEAIKAYDEVIELNPAKAPGAWMSKAVLYSEGLSMINESIDAWVMASGLIPINDIENRSTIWSGMAKSLSDAGRYEEALQSYEKAIELTPKDAHGWPNWSGKADTLYMLGRYSETIEACDTAIEILPKHPDIYIWKGNSLYHLGRHEEALEAYDKALEFNPKDGAAWTGKGRIFYDNGRYEEAVEAYDKAIEFAPFNVTPVLDLYALNLSATALASKGEALKALGRQAEADTAYDKASKLGYQE